MQDESLATAMTEEDNVMNGIAMGLGYAETVRSCSCEEGPSTVSEPAVGWYIADRDFGTCRQALAVRRLEIGVVGRLESSLQSTASRPNVGSLCLSQRMAQRSTAALLWWREIALAHIFVEEPHRERL